MFNKSIKICLIHLVERERERERKKERERERERKKEEVKFPLVEFYFRKNPIVKKRINIRRTQIYFNILSF